MLARTWARPTFEVHGIAGGFTGAGAKTVIPAKAVAKVSFRLVPNQDPERVLAAVKQWVEDNTPKGIPTDVRVLSAGPAISVNPDHPAIHVAAQAFSEMLGQADRLHSQRRLHPNRRRICQASEDPDGADGVRLTR